MHLGAMVKKLAEQRNISVSDLASSLGKSKQAIYHIYKNPHIHTDVLEKVCDSIGITLELFFSQYFGSSLPAQQSNVSESDNLKKQIKLLEKVNEVLEENRRLTLELEEYKRIKGLLEDNNKLVMEQKNHANINHGVEEEKKKRIKTG